MTREVMQQALDALIEYDYAKTDKAIRLGHAAIGAIRTAIAQPDTSIDTLVAEFEAIPGGSDAMEKGKQWVRDLVQPVQPAIRMPKMPVHPEPHTYTWTALEMKAIHEYGKACFDAGGLQPVQREQPECSTHPDAPHGFDRNGSHNNGRYTCDCEGWVAQPVTSIDSLVAEFEAMPGGVDAMEKGKQWVSSLDQPTETKLDRFLGMVRVWVERDDGNMEAALAWMYEEKPVQPANAPTYSELDRIASDLQALCDQQALRLGVLEAQPVQPALAQPSQKDIDDEAFLAALTDPDDRMFEQIDLWTRQSYVRHKSSIRGQQITAADSVDAHRVWAALRWAKEFSQPVQPAPEMLYWAEEYECCMMSLDDAKVPRSDSNGTVYSLWGRIKAYANAQPVQSAEKATCQTCESLARAVMLDQTSHDAGRQPLTHEQRFDLLTAFEEHKHEWHAHAILIDMVEAAHNIKEKNNG